MNAHSWHIKSWLIFMFIGVLLVPVAYKAHDAQRRVMSEVEKVRIVFGQDGADTLVTKANELFTTVFINTGLVQAIQHQRATEEEKRQTATFTNKLGPAFLSSTNAYLEGMVANMYGFFLRLFILLSWLPVLLPVAIGFIGDAYVQRAIKKHRFSYYSPVVSGMAMHFVIFTTMLPVCYLVIPFIMSPLWMPTLAMILFIALWIRIQHSTRIFK